MEHYQSTDGIIYKKQACTVILDGEAIERSAVINSVSDSGLVSIEVLPDGNSGGFFTDVRPRNISKFCDACSCVDGMSFFNLR